MEHMEKDEVSLKQGRVVIVLFVVLRLMWKPMSAWVLLGLSASCLLVVRKYASLSFILSAGTFFGIFFLRKME